MPLLFEGSRIIPNSRSHTTLVKSPGDSPSESWVIDPSLKGLFDYHYGGWTLSKVVIPKGTLVAAGAPVKDYRSLKYKPTLTFAGHGRNAVGVAPYNFFRRFNEDGSIAHDLMEGDDFIPGIITREYIEVPYLPNPEDVYLDVVKAFAGSLVPADAAVKGGASPSGLKFDWGCATNDVNSFATENALKEGDFVKSGPFGKFVKWVAGTDDASAIVGQVLAMHTDVPPEGWLQWVTPETEKMAGLSGGSIRDPYQPTPPPTPEGPYYSPDYKWPIVSDYRSPGAWKTYDGIPGMTDSAQITKTVRVAKFSTENSTDTFQLDPLAKIVKDSIAVYVAGSEHSADDVSFDETANKIEIANTGGSTGTAVAVEVRYQQVIAVGTPPAWDFVGSIGAVGILLKF